MGQKKQYINGYICPDCGAKIIMDENTSVTECVYCGNTAIINERLEGEFKPDKIIPFKKTKEEAISSFIEYKKGKIFMPKEFVDKRNINKIYGIYVPFYVHNIYADAKIDVNCQIISVGDDEKYTYTRTDYYNAHRAGTMFFENLPTDASKKFSDDIMDSIEPYNYEEFVDFSPSYISGFLSEKYDITKEELYQRAENRAKQSAIQILYNDINGYDKKKLENSNVITKITDSSKYVLLPVWMLNVKYKDKIYTLAMNGQTGKFTGNVPISYKKVFKYWVIVFLIVSIIVAICNLLGIEKLNNI